ncbi:hypothetical protein BCEN4_590064 [Burkholderia cenocepacia]|nr:hypothetical protein BCEN4_590064 [Burkholderia cenocepacia]
MLRGVFSCLRNAPAPPPPKKAPSPGRAGRNAAGVAAAGGDGCSAAPAPSSVAPNGGRLGGQASGTTHRRARVRPCQTPCDLAAAIQRLHFFRAGRAHAHGARSGRRSALCLRTVAAGVGALRLRQRAALLLRDACRCGLDCFRIMRIFAAGGVVTGLLELNQFGTNLRTGDRRTRLGERHDRGNESSGNDNGLNERLHDDLPPDLSDSAVNTLISADKPKFM